jgi:hypothetical protein
LPQPDQPNYVDYTILIASTTQTSTAISDRIRMADPAWPVLTTVARHAARVEQDREQLNLRLPNSSGGLSLLDWKE